MLIVGENDFHFIPIENQGPFGKEKYVTNIIKRTYTITPDGQIEPLPLADQPEFSGPTPHDDDLGRSLKYPGDLTDYKPLVDVVINGSAFAPEGEPVEALDVSFELSGLKKTLRVFGNRRWKRDEEGVIQKSEPDPFTVMPIRWEKSFGGLRNPWNRLGVGQDQDHETEPENPVFSLPNIENPTDLLLDLDGDVKPVGFSTIPASWEPRFSLFGTRSAYWANFRSPLPPKDQDARYENAAPEDQQFSDLMGNETITFHNMNENFPVFTITLPNFKPRVFYVPRMESEEEQTLDLIEIDIKLDTIVFDLNDGLLSLLWRGPLSCNDKPLIEKIWYLYGFDDEPSHRIPLETIQKKFEEEIKYVEPIREQMAMTPEILLKLTLAPALAQITKTFQEMGADPALIASVAKITDPEAGMDSLTAKFNKVTADLQKDIEVIKAKFTAKG